MKLQIRRQHPPIISCSMWTIGSYSTCFQHVHAPGPTWAQHIRVIEDCCEFSFFNMFLFPNKPGTCCTCGQSLIRRYCLEYKTRQ